MSIFVGVWNVAFILVVGLLLYALAERLVGWIRGKR